MPDGPCGRARPSPGCCGSCVIGRSAAMSLAGSKTQPMRAAISLAEAFAPRVTATAVSTDMPGRASSAAGSRAFKRMRTVNRRTILVKFPVALSGGISANSEPDAGAIASNVAA